jgi:hypothetical protein
MLKFLALSAMLRARLRFLARRFLLEPVNLIVGGRGLRDGPGSRMCDVTARDGSVMDM